MTTALVCGLGSIGRRHGRNLKALGVDQIIGFDPDTSRFGQFAEEAGAADLFDDLAAALQQSPDLAVIASPNRFHIDQATECAKAGCHLLIEKPLGISMNGVADLAGLIREKNLFAHVGSNFKFHPAFQKMKQLLDDGAIGQVTGAQVLAGQWLPDWHPWEDYRQGYSARSDLGGGIVADSHELDYLCWLLGDVEDVKAMTARTGILEIDTEDVAAVLLRFSSGALASLHLDYIQRSYRRSYHLSGSEGTIEWDMRKGDVVLTDADGQAQTFPCHPDDINDTYLDQSRHVLRGMAGGEPPVTSVDRAAEILKLQMACKAA